MAVRLAPLALFLLLTGCATTPRLSIVPLDLVAEDGRLVGTIERSGRMELIFPERTILVSRPEHFVTGRALVLLNSRTDDGLYVSTIVGSGPCTAAGETFPYRASMCLGTLQEPRKCLIKFTGCAVETSYH